MQFTIKTKILTEALGRVKTVIRSTTLPILSNVLIVAKDEFVEITATNLDQRISVTVPAVIGKDGAITAIADRLLAVVSRGASELVELTADSKNVLTIEGNTRKAKMNCISAEEFPPAMEISSPNSFAVEGDKLMKWLEALQPFQCTDKGRETLWGIHIVPKDGCLRLHATNGRSALAIQTEVKCSGFDCVVPAEAVKAVMTMGNGEVHVEVTDSKVQFTNDDTVIQSKLIEGTFPNSIYQIFPERGSVKDSIKALRPALIHAVAYAETFCDPKSRIVKLSAKKGKLKISASSADVGESEDVIDCEGSMEVACNPEYLKPALKAIDQSEIEIYGGDKGITPIGCSHNGVSFVIMPIRVS